MPFSEYEETLAQQAPTNPYQETLDLQEQSSATALQKSISDASTKSPERHAEVLRFSQQTGLPPALVERNFDSIQKRATVADTDFAKMLRETPKTAEFLSNPDNAAVAKDDHQSLTNLEQMFQFATDAARSLASGFPSANAAIWKLLQAPADILGAKGASQQLGIYALQQEQTAQKWRPDLEKYGFTGKSALGGLEGLGQMLLLLPASLLTGQPEVAAGAFGAIGAGQAYGEAKDKGLSLPRSLSYAAAQGTIFAALTELPVSALTKEFAANSGFLKTVLSELKSAVPAMQAQTLLTDLDRWSQINPEKTLKDFLKERPEAAANTLISTLVGVIGQSAMTRGLSRITKPFLQDLGKQVQESKTGKRLPEALQQFLEHVSKDGPLDSVFIPVEEAQRYFQDSKINPEDVLGPEGNARFQQALQSGEDVRIPTSEYAARIAPSEHATFFNDIVRLGSPEAMNAREEQAFKAEAPPTEESTDDALTQSASRIREDITGQLTGTGLPPKVVDSYARLYEAGFRAMGERSGQDPYALYEPYRLKITRPLPEILRTLPNIDTQLDPLIDRLRSGQLPSQKEMFGTSLVDFLREKGGVKDEGGDLASREPDKDKKPFQKRLLNKKGLPLDTARELAAEAGYIPKDGSLSDFLDAIDKEVRGQPVYAQGGENPQAVEQNVILEQMDQFLKSRDIDLKKASNADVRKAFKEGAEVPVIDGATGTLLAQPGTDLNLEKRGTIHFGPERQFSISLLKDADLSTFLHETGHFYLEVFGDIVDDLKQRGELSEQQQRMVSDYDTALKWLGVESRDKIGREHHEQFARGFEAYLRDGKAPSPELRPLFQRFKAWLTNIYKSLTQLNVNLTDDVRGVFDRLLASDEEIKRAREDANIREMIESQGQAERLGLSPEEYRAYGETVRQARDKAQESLDREYLDEYNRASSDWFQARRNEVREQVANEVQGQRDYMALSFFKDGTLPDGSPLPEGIDASKLDAKALEERYGKYKDSSIVQKLRQLDIYRRENGMDPEQAADLFGYSSADEMVQALLKTRPMDALIDAETDDRMKQSYGDMLTDGTAAEKAKDAVMTEARSQVIEKEMQALAKKVRETQPFRNLGARQERKTQQESRAQGLRTLRRYVPSMSLARDIAQGRIAQLRDRDITPGLYFAAAKRESSAALEAVNRGDFQEALKHKQNELIQVEMYKAATEWKKEIESIRDHMRSFDDPKKRQRLGKAGEEYLDQIDKLRERYDFSRQTNKANDKRASLLDFIKSEEAQGHELAIPQELQNEARQQNYREMTPEELRGLNDAVSSIEHWANFKNKLLRNQAKRELDQLGADGVASIDGNSRGPRKQTIEQRLPGSDKGRKLQNFFLAHLPLGSILREMDGFKDGGFLFENVMRPIDEAGNAEAVRLEHATTAVTDLYRQSFKGEESALWDKQFIPEINDSLTKWGRLMVALNWGNAGNRQRVTSGFGWNDGQVRAILDTLDERDWKFVQGVWDHVNSYWEDISDKQQRVTGVRPEQVEASPVQTKFGAFKGGYFPISYESRLSARAAANPEASFAHLIEQASYTKATTARGHTEARQKNVTMPLRLDPGVITEHLQQVIHDLTHHEMLIDVGRILGRKDIQDAIYRNYSDVAYKEIKSSVRDIALGSTPAPDWYRAFAAIRSNSVAARLGWNMVTALVHVPNITSGMVRVGPKWVVKGVIDSLSSARGAEHSAQWVAEQSDMMRLRWKHRMVELSEFRDEIGLNRGKISSEIHDAVQKLGIDPEVASHFKDSYLYAIHRILQFAEIPTWVGAYDKATASGSDANDARAQADRAILDAIGGGQMKDRASVQKNAIGKVFTTFMTYGLSMHRLGREIILKDETAMRKMVDASLLVLLPTAFITGVHYFSRQHKKDETLATQYRDELVDHALGTFVMAREFQGFTRSPQYSGPSAFGAFGAGKKAAFNIAAGKPERALKATNEVAGELFGYPAYQAEKTVEGTLDMWEGKTKNPSVLLFGPPPQK